MYLTVVKPSLYYYYFKYLCFELNDTNIETLVISCLSEIAGS